MPFTYDDLKKEVTGLMAHTVREIHSGRNRNPKPVVVVDFEPREDAAILPGNDYPRGIFLSLGYKDANDEVGQLKEMGQYLAEKSYEIVSAYHITVGSCFSTEDEDLVKSLLSGKVSEEEVMNQLQSKPVLQVVGVLPNAASHAALIELALEGDDVVGTNGEIEMLSTLPDDPLANVGAMGYLLDAYHDRKKSMSQAKQPMSLWEDE